MNMIFLQAVALLIVGNLREIIYYATICLQVFIWP